MATASSKSVPADGIDDLLACSMCSKTLNEPKSLPCLHNFCKLCLKKYVARLRGADKNIEAFPCPRCRSEFTLKSNHDVAEISSNYFIKNMLDIVTIQRKAKAGSLACSRDGCSDSSVDHCATCDKFMCKKCSEYHDYFTGFKKHDVFSLEELSNPESQVKRKNKLCCAKHPEKMLEYFCKTCEELSCIDCAMFTHPKAENHLCGPISEITQKQRETLQSSSATLDEKLSEGKEALNTVSDVMKALEKNAKTAKDQIKEQKDNILKVVAEKLGDRAKKMNEEVDKVYGELHSELSKQHDEIKDYLDKVQGSVSLPKNLLKRGTINEILSLQKPIDENIKKLRNEKPENLTAVNDGGIEYVPGDIGSINVEAVVDKMGHIVDGAFEIDKLGKSSNILKGNIAFIEQLQKWLRGKCIKWNLCYRASAHGFNAQTFHTHSDNKGPTVVLVQANNCIFGGYTDQNWQATGGYRHSSSSFLFSLRNKDNLAPFIANIKQGLERYAIRCLSGYGPTFGAGHDLHMCDNPRVNNQSYSNFGHTYQLPAGYVYDSEQAKNLLAGQYNFLTKEIEVFN